jgi:hypothetical protein
MSTLRAAAVLPSKDSRCRPSVRGTGDKIYHTVDSSTDFSLHPPWWNFKEAADEKRREESRSRWRTTGGKERRDRARCSGSDLSVWCVGTWGFSSSSLACTAPRTSSLRWPVGLVGDAPALRTWRMNGVVSLLWRSRRRTSSRDFSKSVFGSLGDLRYFYFNLA